MNLTKHSLRIIGPGLVLVLAVVLDHETLARAGSPGSVKQISPTTTGPDVKPSRTGRQQTTASPASKGGTIDYGVFQFGKKIYSTGIDDVIVRVHDSQTVWPVRADTERQISPFTADLPDVSRTDPLYCIHQAARRRSIWESYRRANSSSVSGLTTTVVILRRARPLEILTGLTT